MKLTIAKEKLSTAVSTAEKIAGKNLTLPVLHCILLNATKNTLILRATNLELGIEITVPATVEQEGIVAVPGHVLSQIIASSFDRDQITLLTQEGTLAVSDTHSTTQLKLYDADEFPSIPRVEGETEFTIPAQDFIRGLKAVSYSASSSTIKPELSSVYVYSRGNELVFVATDSFRLAEKVVPLKKSLVMDPFLLPIRTVGDIVRVLEQAQEDITIQCSPHQIALSFGSLYITSRLIEGTFPDYRQIIPKEFVTEVTVLKQDMLHVLRKAAIFSDKFNQITFHIEPLKKSFSVHARNADVGETTDSLSGSFTGEEIHISFNQRYIMDAFQSIASDSISFSLSGIGRPMVLKGISEPTFFYLVMPMNK